MEREYSSIIEQSLIILGLQEPSNLLKRIIHRFDMNEEMIDQMKNIGELEDRFKTLAINRKLDYTCCHKYECYCNTGLDLLFLLFVIFIMT